MQKELSFYRKENGNWYADLPDYIAQGGTEAACVMVAGADDLLEYISKGESRVTLVVAATAFDSMDFYLKNLGVEKVGQEFLDKHNHPVVEYGGTYSVSPFNDCPISQIWLCPVCEWVFGIYPPAMYVKIM